VSSTSKPDRSKQRATAAPVGVRPHVSGPVQLADAERRPQEISQADFLIWSGDVEQFLEQLPNEPIFDLVVSSPPYNIGKNYETKTGLKEYLDWQERVIGLIVPKLKDTGSLCWQVGNFVSDGRIVPLDIEFHPIFHKQKLLLRNRIIWHFGHGLHSQRRFSGRYEVVLWYTKSDNYIFNLDDVRVPAKYPGKKHFKGPKSGELSGNPKGKNPEDVWEFSPSDLIGTPGSVWNIPNVKSNHVEKTAHPCQFPVGLVERLVKGLTNEGQLVFDPFAGVATAGVASALFGRRFFGAELHRKFAAIGADRVTAALDGSLQYRPADKPLYDHRQSKLSIVPSEWERGKQ
jgi:adenine-specific DNA-methyltransferase